MPDLLGDPVIRVLVVVYALLALKMSAVGVYTSTLRLRRKIFATPEDYALRGAPVRTRDEDIERARRAHRNDLENVLPFFVVGFVYVLTRPSFTAAAIYFWGYLIARILHSIFYIRSMQPHRTIAFTAGGALTLAMLVTTLVAVARHA